LQRKSVSTRAPCSSVAPYAAWHHELQHTTTYSSPASFCAASARAMLSPSPLYAPSRAHTKLQSAHPTAPMPQPPAQPSRRRR
jgi:hypothetical protein